MKNTEKKNTVGYSYYSRVLEKPFDSIEELKEAEAAYYDKLKAKEVAANAKRNEAKKVEDAFKALNAARKTYKEELAQLTKEYADSLEHLKKAYELGQKDLRTNLATAETAFDEAYKAFVEKHPEGYHLTLKDGDFETTLSNHAETTDTSVDFSKLADIFNIIFGI
jgi:chromosome segregation ATPase